MMGSIAAHLNPKSGICAIPCTGLGIAHAVTMSIRTTLAENFEALRGKYRDRYRLPDIARAGGPANGTLGRILAKQAGATIDTLERLAEVYDCEPWQLLVPEMNPDKMPQLGGGWPFANITPEQFATLPERVRVEVEERLAGAYLIHQRQKKPPASNGTTGP